MKARRNHRDRQQRHEARAQAIRMHGLGAGLFRHLDHALDVEIAVARPRRAEQDGLIRHRDVHGIGVGGRMDCDGGDAELLAGALHPKRDFAAVGDQDFVEHG